MRKKPTVSLQEYAAANPPTRTKCQACTSEHRAALEEAFSQGVTIPTMHRWLRDVCGVSDVSDSALRHHFSRARHHER